jgi:GT2 family glycosyltransferase
MANVYIIILNWNGWKDTLQCLESVLRSEYRDFRIVVCDNDSSDGSMDKIKAWARGELEIDEEMNEHLRPLVSPPVKKPVPFVEYNRKDAEQGGTETAADTLLVLIQTGSNSGYSGGNNVGMRYALKKKADFIWLLNNDTLVTANTLQALVTLMHDHAEIGLAGNIIALPDKPPQMQAYGGGRLLPLIGTDRFVYSPGKLGYVSGTSLFIRREVAEQIGLLDESFFFYWEDVDYSTRALKNGWKLGVVEDAVVYHKFSASVGGQSLKSDLFKVASLTRYFKKHRKFWFFPVFVNIKGMLIKRFFRGQFNRIIPIIKAMFKS